MVGLTAAIALRHYGIDSLVFEQGEPVRKTQPAVGMSLGYNVARAFKHLGRFDELADVSVPLKQFEFNTKDGKRLGTVQSLDGETALGILRPLFLDVLLEAAGEGTVQLGSKLIHFEQDGDGVTAHFADGRTARGEVLLGVDGLRSTVRAQLLGESQPRYAGYTTRRGVAESDWGSDGIHRVMYGRGQRFVLYPVGSGRVYWNAAMNEPAGAQETGAQIKRQVLERFGGWADPVEALVTATDESTLVLGDTYDRDPVDRWGEGRVTLLGDAAHPMTWDRAQGAGQGIQGAVLLARRLAQGDDPAAALRDWEAEQIPRAKRMVLASRRTGMTEQSEKARMCFMRTQMMKVVTRGPLFARANRKLLIEY